MALVRIYDFAEGTLEQYDRLMSRFEGALAPGNLLHASGAFALDVFESREAADRVFALVAEAAQGVGLTPPEISEFETHNLLRA